MTGSVEHLDERRTNQTFGKRIVANTEHATDNQAHAPVALDAAIPDLSYKIRDVQSLMTAISHMDQGGVNGRLADMAEKQLEEIVKALDNLH